MICVDGTITYRTIICNFGLNLVSYNLNDTRYVKTKLFKMAVFFTILNFFFFSFSIAFYMHTIQTSIPNFMFIFNFYSHYSAYLQTTKTTNCTLMIVLILPTLTFWNREIQQVDFLEDFIQGIYYFVFQKLQSLEFHNKLPISTCKILKWCS